MKSFSILFGATALLAVLLVPSQGFMAPLKQATSTTKLSASATFKAGLPFVTSGKVTVGAEEDIEVGKSGSTTQQLDLTINTGASRSRRNGQASFQGGATFLSPYHTSSPPR